MTAARRLARATLIGAALIVFLPWWMPALESAGLWDSTGPYIPLLLDRTFWRAVLDGEWVAILAAAGLPCIAWTAVQWLRPTTPEETP